MTENHRQPDHHEDLDLPQSLVNDLRTALGPLDTVPGEADDRILAMGRRNLGRHRRLRLVASVATLTAAAAAIALVFLLPSSINGPRSSDAPGAKPTQTSPLAGAGTRRSEPATEVAGQRRLADATGGVRHPERSEGSQRIDGSAPQPEDSPGAKRTQTQTSESVAQLTATPEDIDESGRVDILDALALARHIDRRDSYRPGWDINRDGRLDQQDIDAIARTAVRLNPKEATP